MRLCRGLRRFDFHSCGPQHWIMFTAGGRTWGANRGVASPPVRGCKMIHTPGLLIFPFTTKTDRITLLFINSLQTPVTSCHLHNPWSVWRNVTSVWQENRSCNPGLPCRQTPLCCTTLIPFKSTYPNQLRGVFSMIMLWESAWIDSQRNWACEWRNRRPVFPVYTAILVWSLHTTHWLYR